MACGFLVGTCVSSHAHRPSLRPASLTPRPNVLTLHFFLVALHAVGSALRKSAHPRTLLHARAFIQTACQILLPLLAAVSSWEARVGVCQSVGAGVSNHVDGLSFRENGTQGPLGGR